MGTDPHHVSDVIVIGAGHAGCEAALAAARMGATVRLFTFNLDTIGQMSCNPSIGGIAKGHVVCEIDALGGEMARNTDASRIQFRVLNRRKGPAVWSPRAQTDKLIYQKRMKHVLEQTPHLFVHQAEVIQILHNREKVLGIRTIFQEDFFAGAVVVCTGTFLRGLLHFGLQQYPGGRAGDPASTLLSEYLETEMGLQMERLKTGTPPRILGKSIDFASLELQESEEGYFTHWPETIHEWRSIAPPDLPQMPCYITHSNEKTRQIILNNLHLAPMYNGTIKGKPTRYCPSFEDKIVRFQDHETHQIYVEPEGAFTGEYYLNGISTSLPIHVQHQMIRSLPGFERAEITRYAYAIEYDRVTSHQIQPDLSVRRWPNLFLAGQINGTTGYEEAAGQGLIAGANAAIVATQASLPPLILGRNQAYIGVMIDDLVTKEITEPYRLFTSRAEYRLTLRHDNAVRRLARLAHQYGLLSSRLYEKVKEEEEQIQRYSEWLKKTPSGQGSLWDAIRTRQKSIQDIEELKNLPPYVRQQIEIDAIYEGYVNLELKRIEQLKKLEDTIIPKNFPYEQISGLRKESIQKLQKYQPRTLGQAGRIDGVTPAEVALIQVMIKRMSG